MVKSCLPPADTPSSTSTNRPDSLLYLGLLLITLIYTCINSSHPQAKLCTFLDNGRWKAKDLDADTLTNNTGDILIHSSVDCVVTLMTLRDIFVKTPTLNPP